MPERTSPLGNQVATVLLACVLLTSAVLSPGLPTAVTAESEDEPGLQLSSKSSAKPSDSASSSAATVGAASSGPAYGDFNSDGFDDLAIGVPFEAIGAIPNAGAVNVLYGSGSGLQTSSPADQFWSENSPGVRGESEEGDQFGQSLAVGDFNDDGFDDLAIGAPFEDVDSVEGAGAVNVLYGSSSGLQATSPDDQRWNQDSPGVEEGAEAGVDEFGWSLASGDFNDDGFDDLAIGVPLETIGSILGAGAANVLYGSGSGLQTSSPADQFWSENSPGVRGESEEGDRFGLSLTAGDFNGDGKDDLAVGISSESVVGAGDAGAVNVLYGSSSGLQATSPDDQRWNQDSPGVNDIGENNDEFGRALASGDFNSDGFDDLAIGAPFEDIGGASDAGAVNVLYGSSSGLQTSSPADQFWNQNTPDVASSAELNDFFGDSLVSGDFNNDGNDDLAIGVVFEGVAGKSDAGAVNVIYGSSDGLRATTAGDGTGRVDQFWNQDSPGVEDAVEGGDFFGGALATGDFNGDGKDDLAIGVGFENIGSILNAGAVNVLYGSSSGLQTSSPGDQFWNQNSPGVDDNAETEDSFGFALA